MASEDSNDKRAHVVRLANIRQELTAPVAAIVGYAEILREEAGEDHSNELASDVQQIHTAAHQLSQSAPELSSAASMCTALNSQVPAAMPNFERSP